MANAVVASWTACVRELQQMLDTADFAEADVSKLFQRADRLGDQLSLPHAAWKKLVHDVQITAKLAALYVQVLRQPDAPEYALLLTYAMLTAWLVRAVAAIEASPGSRATAAVVQQLQDSQLLQHLGPAMDAAAARLTTAVAALAAATAAASNSSSSSMAVPSTANGHIRQLSFKVMWADSSCDILLRTLDPACALWRTGLFGDIIGLPAAPAAVRLMLTVCQVQGKLQQLRQHQLLQPHTDITVKWSKAMRTVPVVMLAFAEGLESRGVSNTLQLYPAASELLLLPESVSCLAIVLVSVLLGLDTSSDDWLKAAVTTATSSSSTPGVGSSTGRQAPGTGVPQPPPQQQQQHRPGNSGGSGGSSSSSSSSSGMAAGVRLGSLTPLSCGLFPLLGITKETALQAARLAKAQGLTTLASLDVLVAAYRDVIVHQVKLAQGAFSAQLLLQLETDLLLSLVLLQLTASIPDSNPGALVAREMACQLCSCGALFQLWQGTNLHQLPRPAAYTGPQLALQLLPSPFKQPPLPQQQQRQQRQQQPAEWCVLAPTAPLLTELLPLLTRQCLFQLQQLQLRYAALPIAQPHPETSEAVRSSILCLSALLLCSVVPALGNAAGSSPPAADAAAAVAATAGKTSYVLHTHEVLMQHASAILSIFEAALRCQTTLCNAAPPAAGAAPMTADSPMWFLCRFAGMVVYTCYPQVLRRCPDHPSPLVLLALAAGPGSQIQRQLHSLLATMVKLGGWGKGAFQNSGRLALGAADIAAALLGGAAEQQQHVGAAAAAAGGPGGNSSLAVITLPSAVILGRCYMQWAAVDATSTLFRRRRQQHEPRSTHDQQQQAAMVSLQSLNRLVLHLSGMQGWLAAGSTCEQLACAGYAPEAVQQLVEQMLATCHALKDNPPDTAAVLTAAQQLQSTGLALCSFAVPCMCNNPGCASMAGLSELAAVSGRSCICAGCRVARYCGRACQRAAWKQHKPKCAALSVAAAGAGTGAAAAAPMAAEPAAQGGSS